MEIIIKIYNQNLGCLMNFSNFPFKMRQVKQVRQVVSTYSPKGNKWGIPVLLVALDLLFKRYINKGDNAPCIIEVLQNSMIYTTQARKPRNFVSNQARGLSKNGHVVTYVRYSWKKGGRP